MYGLHADNVRKTKEQFTFISGLKTDVPPIIGGLGKGKESTTPITEILTPQSWNALDGLIGLYPRALKCLKYQRLKLQAGIDI